jgi:SAM-dependent methyltransferase
MNKNTSSNGTEQSLYESEELDEIDYRYHQVQWETPKESTLVFESFASQHISTSKNIIDLGAGSGAATAFLATRHNSTHFTAFDYSSELTQLGSKMAASQGIKNLSFEQGDWFNMSPTKNFDGCISLQTLSWLPDCEKPLVAIFKDIKPKWIAITSLFYEGDISCRIEVEEHKRKSFYNVYSLPAISRLCQVNGFSLVKAVPFEIGINIEKSPNLDIMGTYTRVLVSGNDKKFERTQISGPLLMNWYMLLIKKIK